MSEKPQLRISPNLQAALDRERAKATVEAAGVDRDGAYVPMNEEAVCELRNGSIVFNREYNDEFRVVGFPDVDSPPITPATMAQGKVRLKNDARNMTLTIGTSAFLRADNLWTLKR